MHFHILIANMSVERDASRAIKHHACIISTCSPIAKYTTCVRSLIINLIAIG